MILPEPRQYRRRTCTGAFVRRALPIALLPAALLLAAGSPTTPLSKPNRPGWMAKHEANVKEIHSRPVDLIFLGDSVTEELKDTSQKRGDIHAVWQRFYACRNAVNLGIGGDNTANLLWRIENGEVDGIRPRLAVVMIGSNRGRDISDVPLQAQRIAAVVDEVHRRLPHTHILLLGMPPNGRPADEEATRVAVNHASAAHDWASDDASFLLVDSPLQHDGKVDTSLYVNGDEGRAMHPNGAGWQKLAAFIEPSIEKLMGVPGTATASGAYCHAPSPN